MSAVVKISIVIPIFNVGRHLRSCLDSCLAQTLPEIEIVCVNDCSPDDAGDVLRAYADRDGRVRVVTFTENRGTLEARRAGVEVARGEYALFVDADDMLKPNACERLWGMSEGADFVIFALEAFADGGEEARRMADSFNARRLPDPSRNLTARDVLTDLFVLENSPLGLAGKLWRTRLVKAAYEAIPSGYCVCGEDGLVVFAVLARGPNGSRVSDRLYGYRFGGGISTTVCRPYSRRLAWLRSGAFCARVLSACRTSVLSDEIRAGVWRCLVERAVLAARWEAGFWTRLRLLVDGYASLKASRVRWWTFLRKANP